MLSGISTVRRKPKPYIYIQLYILTVLVDHVVGRLLGSPALSSPAAPRVVVSAHCQVQGRILGPEDKSSLDQSLLQREARVGQLGHDGDFHPGVGLAPSLRSLGLEEVGQGLGIPRFERAVGGLGRFG